MEGLALALIGNRGKTKLGMAQSVVIHRMRIYFWSGLWGCINLQCRRIVADKSSVFLCEMFGRHLEYLKQRKVWVGGGGEGEFTFYQGDKL